MQKQYYACLIFGLAAGLIIAKPSFGADQSGWFFGLSMTRPPPRLELPSISFAGRDDNGYKLSAGYRFGPHWKAELHYVDIGQPSLKSNPTASDLASQARGKGLQVVGTASMPLTEKIDLFGKLGAIHSNLASSCATNILTCSVADRSTDLNYGVGLRYDFTKTVSVKGEWERFRRFGSHDAIGETDRDFFSVGLGFKF
jgi:OOP family OmpA-OmpF porin